MAKEHRDEIHQRLVNELMRGWHMGASGQSRPSHEAARLGKHLSAFLVGFDQGRKDKDAANKLAHITAREIISS